MSPEEYRARVLKLKKREIELLQLEKQAVEQRELPHLHLNKHYKWSREFFESKKKKNFLCAANQTGKSSVQIKKAIEWATNPKLWPALWPGRTPNQFWYFYPNFDTWSQEYQTKWEPLLPKGKMQIDPMRGWKTHFERNQPKYIRFNSGVSIFCKAYSQKAEDLQAGTVFSMFCFAPGTLIKTIDGDVPIEAIKVGDMVLSHLGYRRVLKTMKREAEVITREFSSGQKITATKDHPFYTKEAGWVEFGLLNEGHTCYRRVPCEQPNSLSTRDLVTTAGQTTKILVREIISLTKRASSFMWLSGKLCTREGFQKATSFIIGIINHFTTTQRTYSYSLDPSTREFTNSRSGSLKRHSHMYAAYAGETLFQEPLGRIYRTFALRDAAEKATSKTSSAFFAKENLNREEILAECTALNFAQTEAKQSAVYNLEVEEANTYFANGILVHNCDEEVPEPYMGELFLRLAASDGYMHAAFTATLGQDYWRRTIEPTSTQEELHPDALKIQISMYDCLKYEDGSPSHWTHERIKRIEQQCGTEAEKQKRVFGKFVVAGGRKYESFEIAKNTVEAHPIPPNWNIYSGVDIGSGGEGGHPAAISFVAVSPDCKLGRVFKVWRGDGLVTDPASILDKYIEMRGSLKPLIQSYDYSSRDFYTIASARGETFTPAIKKQDEGVETLNSLFKNEMLALQIGECPEMNKLVIEITSLLKSTPKSHARDDLLDCLRYCVMPIPWNWKDGIEDYLKKMGESDKLKPPMIRQETAKERELRERRGVFNESNVDPIEEEIQAWGELYEP